MNKLQKVCRLISTTRKAFLAWAGFVFTVLSVVVGIAYFVENDRDCLIISLLLFTVGEILDIRKKLNFREDEKSHVHSSEKGTP